MSVSGPIQRPILIFDTNIMVAGLRSSRGASFRLLQAIGGGQFDLGLTAALVLEYEAVLTRAGLVPLDAEDIQALLNYWCQVGVCRAVRFRVRPAALDPGDDLILEAAIATHSTAVVTLNPRHMRAGAAEYGIELRSPGEAVREFGVVT